MGRKRADVSILPVTIVVPYPAGGPTDTLARILADHMRTSLGQTLIIVG
jgi:tripartite-type tricarboxylate transporter receptor subunit TctC